MSENEGCDTEVWGILSHPHTNIGCIFLCSAEAITRSAKSKSQTTYYTMIMSSLIFHTRYVLLFSFAGLAFFIVKETDIYAVQHRASPTLCILTRSTILMFHKIPLRPTLKSD